MMDDDVRTVTRQLGRAPRGVWRVKTRCSYGRPTVIVTAPEVEGEPFPTLYYLTCPHLVGRISLIESEGGVAAWRDSVHSDSALAARLADADTAYREARRAEGGDADPAGASGIGGVRDPLGVKCLHAHVAAYIAGIDDPVGEGVLASLPRECDDDRCREVA